MVRIKAEPEHTQKIEKIADRIVDELSDSVFFFAFEKEKGLTRFNSILFDRSETSNSYQFIPLIFYENDYMKFCVYDAKTKILPLQAKENDCFHDYDWRWYLYLSGADNEEKTEEELYEYIMDYLVGTMRDVIERNGLINVLNYQTSNKFDLKLINSLRKDIIEENYKKFDDADEHYVVKENNIRNILKSILNTFKYYGYISSYEEKENKFIFGDCYFEFHTNDKKNVDHVSLCFNKQKLIQLGVVNLNFSCGLGISENDIKRIIDKYEKFINTQKINNEFKI